MLINNEYNQIIGERITPTLRQESKNNTPRSKNYESNSIRLIPSICQRAMNWVALLSVPPLLLFLIGCKKLVQINAPVSTITTTEIFGDSADAESALMGLYSKMLNGSNANNISFGCGVLSIYTGSSADELLPFNQGSDASNLSTNSVQSTNSVVSSFIWDQAYTYLYQVNSIIAGVQQSNALDIGVKNQILGEAQFFRAFINFYLVNLFGNIPLITSTNFSETDTASARPMSVIYEQIADDLHFAEQNLPKDFSLGGGERIRANAWAAIALLARLYLFQNNWNGADSCSSAVINSGVFSLVSDLNQVFLANSNEAILQWQINSSLSTSYYNCTPEGYKLIPKTPTSPPFYYVTPELMSAFEVGDHRKLDWIDSTTYSRTKYYYPYKYKVGVAEIAPNGAVTEYYMVLRLAEQYLIRAEAEAQIGGAELPLAIIDLNTIRSRAGLDSVSPSLSPSQVLAAIAQERRIELFAEWGNRWLDLNRTGQAQAVLSTISYKQPWRGDYQLLYPIPLYEIQTDPDLHQNPGY